MFEDHHEEICGLVVSVRPKNDRLSLWTKTAINRPLAEAIGRKFKEVLGLDAGWSIGFQPHSDAIRQNSSYNSKEIYHV